MSKWNVERNQERCKKLLEVPDIQPKLRYKTDKETINIKTKAEKSI
jgi:hypothetical protein